MTPLAQTVTHTAAIPTPAPMPVRYVGGAFAKRDNLLGTKRVWARGEILMVPADEARRYLKHKNVWRHADDPWDEAALPAALSAEAVLDALRRGDLEALKDAEPAIYALLSAPDQPSDGPLRDADATALEQYVPALAQALTQVGAVADKIDTVADLLRSFPPLWDGCMEAEKAAKGRSEVIRKLRDIAQAPQGATVNQELGLA